MIHGTRQILRRLALFGVIATGSLVFAASAQATGSIAGTIDGVDREQEEVFKNRLCGYVYSKSSSPDSTFLGSAAAEYPSGSYRASMHGTSPFPDGSYRVMFDDCLPSDGELRRGDPEEEHFCGISCGYRRVWYDGSRSGAGSFQTAADVVIAGSDVSGVDVAISLYGKDVSSPGSKSCVKAKKKLRKAKKNDGKFGKKQKQLNKAKKKLKRKKKAKKKACKLSSFGAIAGRIDP